MKKLFYYFGLFLLTLSLCFDSYYSYVFDPCGYVGSSNDPTITDFCLSTSTDCCYVKWVYNLNDYYACVSKTKLIANGLSKNITMGFTRLFTNTTISERISHSISSKCNSTAGVIVTLDLLPSTGTVGRMLTGSSDMNLNHNTNYETFSDSVKDRISYYLKYAVYKILDLLFFV